MASHLITGWLAFVFVAMDDSLQTEFIIWEHMLGLHLGYLIFDVETQRRRFDEHELAHWDEWLVRGNA